MTMHILSIRIVQTSTAHKISHFAFSFPVIATNSYCRHILRLNNLITLSFYVFIFFVLTYHLQKVSTVRFPPDHLWCFDVTQCHDFDASLSVVVRLHIEELYT